MTEHEIDIRFNLLKIHPVMRYRVRAIVDALDAADCDVRLYVFGSAITDKMGIKSDLDLGYSTRKDTTPEGVRKLMTDVYNSFESVIQNLDIFDLDRMEDCALKTAILQGVIVKDFKEAK